MSEFCTFDDVAPESVDTSPGESHALLSAPARLHVDTLVDLLIVGEWTVEAARATADHYAARAEWWRLHRGHGEPAGAVRITTTRWSGLYVPVSAQGAPCDLPAPDDVSPWPWPTVAAPKPVHDEDALPF